MNTTAEFLRKLADLIDSVDTSAQNIPLPPPPPPPPSVVIAKTEPGGNEKQFQDNTAEVSDETEIMVPPLQQKMELLKKIAGVESVYDEKTCECEGECNCECSQENTDQEINTIRKNAGLAIAISDDFPEE